MTQTELRATFCLAMPAPSELDSIQASAKGYSLEQLVMSTGWDNKQDKHPSHLEGNDMSRSSTCKTQLNLA